MLLEGKTAIVAGVGPGLGRDVALLFAEHGANLVIGARRRERCDEIADEVRAQGGKVEVVTLDVTSAEACAAAVDQATSSYGRVDVLVNNAFNEGDFTTFEDANFDSWRRTMDINLWGTLQMTKAAVVPMKDQGGGRVVMINSMSAWRHQPNFGAYTISKAALESATRMLATELGQHGIRVNGIHPGYIWGDSVKLYFQFLAVERGVTAEQVYEDIAGETCLKYLPPSAEIAGSVLFMASDLAGPVTGQSLGVNAGHWIH